MPTLQQLLEQDPVGLGKAQANSHSGHSGFSPRDFNLYSEKSLPTTASQCMLGAG